jgi:hypothetical protein
MVRGRHLHQRRRQFAQWPIRGVHRRGHDGNSAAGTKHRRNRRQLWCDDPTRLSGKTHLTRPRDTASPPATARPASSAPPIPPPTSAPAATKSEEREMGVKPREPP